MITLQLLGIYPAWLISLALYSLVSAKELAPHKPLAKFSCINGIVFSCFGQGVVLEILVALGIVKANHFWLDVEHLEEALQNVLACVGMVLFAVLQQYAYNVGPYQGDVAEKFKLNKKNE